MNDMKTKDSSSRSSFIIKLVGFLVASGILAAIVAYFLPIIFPKKEPPVAVIKSYLKEGRAPLKVLFDGASSKDPEAKPIKYHWEIDGAFVSDKESFTKEFSEPKQYQITLTVKDIDNKTDKSSVIVNVLPQVSSPHKPIKIHYSYSHSNDNGYSYMKPGDKFIFYNEKGGGKYGNDIAGCNLNENGQIQAYNKDSAIPSAVIGEPKNMGCSESKFKSFIVKCCIEE